ncbi:uncharacterized protein RSE6_12967 [Rhynchosporium secalis]|uniref:Uncharacterized protein n=1 Tax=Rhynchosporium secalis TaxID=38038 RepID=A0A1E1MSI9_RHYSE|nr:uncharacterized protein RSE6_12967 [Rhynchosporium secalis]
MRAGLMWRPRPNHGTKHLEEEKVSTRLLPAAGDIDTWLRQKEERQPFETDAKRKWDLINIVGLNLDLETFQTPGRTLSSEAWDESVVTILIGSG